MNVQSFLDNMTKIQKDLLQYLDHTDDVEENYQNLQVSLSLQNITENSHNLKSVLYLITNVATNHYRYPNFFDKIEKILTNLLSIIKKTLSNHEIFDIFKKNKRLLLFLFKEEVITIDKYIYNKMKTAKYSKYKYEDYFSPEINQSGFKQNQFGINIPKKIEENRKEAENFEEKRKEAENFEEKRKEAENDNSVCKLIQKDSIDEFISYISQNNLSLNSKIEPSIYETNPILLKNQYETQNQRRNFYFFGNNDNNKDKISLIEYATFFGSIQIFNYLYKNNVKLTPSLWIYAIHSDHPELFSILEENNVEHDKETSFENLLYESITCHHNDMANYILNNYIQDEKKIKDDILSYAIKYYNFSFIQNENDSLFDDSLFYLVRYNYYFLVKLALTEKNIDINQIYEIGNIEESLLCYAIEKNIKEIVQLFLSNENIDANLPKKVFRDNNQSRRIIYIIFLCICFI